MFYACMYPVLLCIGIFTNKRRMPKQLSIYHQKARKSRIQQPITQEHPSPSAKPSSFYKRPCSQSARYKRRSFYHCKLPYFIQTSSTSNKTRWSPQPLLKDHQRPSFLKTCLLELKTWFYDIPHELRIDHPNDVPHVYTLHMVYHTARILLAKPFLTNHHTSSESTITVLAHSVCKDSASAICLVAQKYRHSFAHGFQLCPLSATHCTLSAATVLLGEPDCASNRNRLGVCLTVL